MQLAAEDVVLVTGGASGLGAATARRLHDTGAQVVVVDLPSHDGAAVESTIGARASFVPADVTDPHAVGAAVAHAAGLGPLRVVVTCAGIATASRIVTREGPHDLDVFARTVAVNLVGTFNVLRLAATAMADTDPRDGERGVLVHTASVAAFDGQIGQAAYSASKGGVAALTLPAARELAEHLLRVVAIAPGVFATPMVEAMPAEVRDGLASDVPHPRRLGDPEEFARLVAHVVDNAYLNGEVIRLDGGLRMQPR